MSGAVVSAILHVVILRERRDHGGSAGNLADMLQNDFRPAIVELDRTFNFDRSSRQPAHISHVPQIRWKHHHGERARHLVLAEVEEMHALHANLYPLHVAGNAGVLAHMLVGFRDGNAVGGA